MSLPQRLWGFDSEFIPSPGTARCEPCRPAREAIAGLVVGLCFVTGLGAQAIREDRTTSANQKANEQVRSTEGAITPAAALVGQKFNDGKFAGQIRKLLFDLDAGRVAFVVVAMGDKAKGESEEIVLPAELFSDLAQLEIKLPADKLESRSPLPAKAEELTRAWAAKIYDQSGLTPYWKQEDAKFNDNDLLISSDRVKNTPVVDDKGKKIAQVQDFAVTSQGAIAYAGIAKVEDTKRLYPVPLSAFVVAPGESTWRLDLPHDIIENTPTFAANEWPKTLDRGWLEYVHVRYGRSVFDGVNRRPRPTQARKTPENTR